MAECCRKIRSKQRKIVMVRPMVALSAIAESANALEAKLAHLVSNYLEPHGFNVEE